MKRISLIAMMLLASAGFASAQLVSTVSGDVLGAHLNYGRGCAACHAPHSGARGNGISTTDTTSGNVALWGEDVGPLVGQVLVFGGTGKASGNGYSETLPSFAATTPDVAGVLTCLSCHDGNYAKGAMMQNKVYETLPSTYASQNVPTLLGADGNGNTTGATAYLNDHPVGLAATFGCNTAPTGQTYGGESGYNWDCGIASGQTGSSIKITAGPNMAQFINNYGFFVSLGNNNGTPVVLCTTCHNQHVMNVVSVGTQVTAAAGTAYSTASGLAAGRYMTMFFLRGPYNPASGTTGSNQNAQFCRQCHGGESNEMNGSTATTTF
jgi:hypothetical protein